MPLSPEEQAADLALMRGVAAGEAAAVGRLYDRFGALVYRMSYQALPSRNDADEAVQEVFVRLWRTAGRYDPTRAALVTWVMLLTRRYLVDRLRRQRTSPKFGVIDERAHGVADTRSGVGTAGAEGEGAGWSGMGGGVVDPERAERFAAVMKKVEKLPALQRTVVIRAYLNGQTLRQIGEELDTPLGTIKSALSRALVRLRENELSEGVPG
jgi:RNA polymerase sigma-70 factor (ECF subfamily)